MNVDVILETEYRLIIIIIIKQKQIATLHSETNILMNHNRYSTE